MNFKVLSKVHQGFFFFLFDIATFLRFRVEQCKSYSAKVEEQLLDREKTISELERR